MSLAASHLSSRQPAGCPSTFERDVWSSRASFREFSWDLRRSPVMNKKKCVKWPNDKCRQKSFELTRKKILKYSCHSLKTDVISFTISPRLTTRSFLTISTSSMSKRWTYDLGNMPFCARFLFNEIESFHELHLSESNNSLGGIRRSHRKAKQSRMREKRNGKSWKKRDDSERAWWGGKN